MDKKKTTKKRLKYRIEDIQEKEFYYKNLSDEDCSQFPENSLKIGLRLLFDPDLTNDKLVIGLQVIYQCTINAIEVEILKLDVRTTFKIFEYQDLIYVKDMEGEPEVVIDDKVLSSFLGILIGTARGIILTKTRGSYLNKYYLPVFNPREVIKSLNPQNIAKES